MKHSPPRIDREWVEQTAQRFLQSAANDLNMPEGQEPAFDAPLFGVAAGNDPLWSTFKICVGPWHWEPRDAFLLGWPESDAQAEELCVICWILPQTRATKRDNRKQQHFPAERWARARIFGESLVNNGLRQYLVEALGAEGVEVVAPSLLPQWSTRPSEQYVFSSTWSERHAAFAAGLGTFGLCDGLITPLGKAMRVGSIIARLGMPVTVRPCTSHTEYCLFHTSGACRACISRCPAGALSERGHDKTLCSAYLDEVTRPYVTQTFHFDGYGCGLCQVGVPCEKGIPRTASLSVPSP